MPGPHPPFPAIPYPVVPDGEALSLAVPTITVPCAQYAPLGGTVHYSGPQHGGKLRGVGARPQGEFLLALGEAQCQQIIPELKRRILKRSPENQHLRRTLGQWPEVDQRSRGPPRDIAEILLDNKALLDPKETPIYVYVTHIWFHGHRYCIGDDPVRWADFKNYLHLLREQGTPSRKDYIHPRDLCKVQSRKA